MHELEHPLMEFNDLNHDAKTGGGGGGGGGEKELVSYFTF